MQRRLGAVVDVMRVPAEGEASSAIVEIGPTDAGREIECDVLVVGGGTGGVAAAWAAARQGHNTCLLEETDWLGGQLTSQGVSALDEHEHIETFGATRSYYRLRRMIREHYLPLVKLSEKHELLNPGNCWVSGLAFEPAIAAEAIANLLQPHLEDGSLRLFRRHKAYGVDVHDDVVRSLLAVCLETKESVKFRATVVLDATELGDLLPLSGVEYHVGAESKEQTQEPHAQPTQAKPHCVQSFTYTFALTRGRSTESRPIEKPTGYAQNRNNQPYTLRIFVHGGEVYSEETGWLEYKLFERTTGTKGSLWEYRRLIDASQFADESRIDISMLNWPSMDYYRDRSILDQDPLVVVDALQEAKRLSLGFAYWLKAEADGLTGHSDLFLNTSVMDTTDGLSKFPYIREGRRIRALQTVVEQDVSQAYQPGPRARHYDDSVGLGWYPIDIHKSGPDDVGVSARTRPFQIPLGSLIPHSPNNILAAGKNIGTTHITNGCYRLHPVEWNAGEAAGLLAAFCVDHHVWPKAVRVDDSLLQRFQRLLLEEGIPLYWATDVSHEDGELFQAVQLLAMSQLLEENGAVEDLRFKADARLTTNEEKRVRKYFEEKCDEASLGITGVSRGELARYLYARQIW